MCLNLVIIWTVLYFFYNKYFHVFLRNSYGYGYTFRNRLSNTSWSFIFNIGSIIFAAILWNYISKPEINIALLKSICTHYAIYLTQAGYWLKGFSHIMLIFSVEITQPSSQVAVKKIFILKSIDSLILDFCRLFYLNVSKKINYGWTKYIYALYCIYWTYMYMVYVPVSVLLPYKQQSVSEKLFLWMWFISQYLDLVWLDVIKYYNTKKFLEHCLFPSPSIEFIHLTEILRNFNIAEKRKAKPTASTKKEFWQTLICAMKIKKRLKRMKKCNEGTSSMPNKKIVCEERNFEKPS